MKDLKHILSLLLLLVTILFCLGLEVYTNYSNPVCNTELTSQQEGEENIVLQNDDLIEDEYFNQDLDVDPFVEPLLLVPFSNKLIVFKEYSLSNWQPPKFC